MDLINTLAMNAKALTLEKQITNPESNTGTVNPSWMFELDNVQPWAYWDDLFTKGECEKIIEMGNSLIAEKAIVGDKDTREVNTQLRNSEVSWLYPTSDMLWVFQRVASATNILNQQFFNFDVYGMTEGFQFTKYHPGGYYGMHVDRSVNLPPRKLSITIQLNPSSEFEGGDLLLHDNKTPTKPEMKQGKLLMFPSYVLHEVTPVTEGTRYSLVCWITGKPFK